MFVQIPCQVIQDCRKESSFLFRKSYYKKYELGKSILMFNFIYFYFSQRRATIPALPDYS